MQTIYNILNNSFNLTLEMAPYLWLGFIAAGVLHVYVPVNRIARHLGKESLGSIFKASSLGIPIPLCSCGVLPVAASLRKAGASKSATLSFLITTPVTGVDSLMATWALLGWGFTIIRLGVSLVIGLLTGLTMKLLKTDNHGIDQQNLNDNCNDKSCVTDIAASTLKENFSTKLKAALHYTIIELPASLAGSLIFGLLLAGILSTLLPPQLIHNYFGQGIWGILAAIIFAIPLYVCATASIPIAAALVMTGFTPGAALAFIIAGPATNLVAIATTKKILGLKATLIYLFSIFIGALSSGVLLDQFGLEWSMKAIQAHQHEQFSTLQLVSALVLLGSLTLYYAKDHILPRLKKLLPSRNEQLAGLIKLSIPEMSCNSCVNTIKNTLKEYNGLTKVNVELVTKEVTFILEDRALLNEIMDDLKSKGYDSSLIK
jgi:uncharacterized membrane protein YraQ (UPF0718 family)/copper chaperone CopZ